MPGRYLSFMGTNYLTFLLICFILGKISIREVIMRMLSRSEEMVLVTVWKLKDKAYSVPIREYLRKITGKRWSFGSVYNPLNRLEQKGLLDSYTTEPVKERGGRSKRIYRVTASGQEALVALWEIQASLWEAAPELWQ